MKRNLFTTGFIVFLFLVFGAGCSRYLKLDETIEFCVNNRTLIATEPMADPTKVRTSGAYLRSDGHGERWHAG